MSKAQKAVAPQAQASSPAPVSSVPYDVTKKISVSPYYLSFMTSYDDKYDALYYEGSEAKVAKREAQQPKAAKKSKKAYAAGSVIKRPLFICLILIFMLAVLGVGVLGYVSIEAVDEYVSVFDVSGDAVYYHDPIFGAIEEWASDYIDPLGDSVYYDKYLSTIQTENIAITISLYVLPIALVLIVIFTLIMVIKALIALFGSKQRKLGFLSLIITILALFVAACGVIWNGMGLGEVLSVILGDGAVVSAAYGLYAIIGLPLLATILSGFAYKKIK